MVVILAMLLEVPMACLLDTSKYNCGGEDCFDFGGRLKMLPSIHHHLSILLPNTFVFYFPFTFPSHLSYIFFSPSFSLLLLLFSLLLLRRERIVEVARTTAKAAVVVPTQLPAGPPAADVIPTLPPVEPPALPVVVGIR